MHIIQTDDVAIHGLIQSLTGMSVGELGAQFSGFGGGIGMLDGIIPLAKLLADFLRCFETDRLEAYDTEADMEEAALKWFQEDKLLAGNKILCTQQKKYQKEHQYIVIVKFKENKITARS